MFAITMNAHDNWPKVQELYNKSRNAGMSHVNAVEAVKKLYKGVGPGNQKRLEEGYAPQKPDHETSTVISTLDLKRLANGGGDWNVTGVKLKKSKLTTFKGRDVVETIYGKNSGTGKDPGTGGFIFTAKPNKMNNQEIAFSWDVFYPKGFNYVRGGKHGGTFIGTGVASGYRHSPDGASNRIMWQVDGGIISYVYPSSGLKQKIPGLEPEGHGIGFFKDELAKALKYDTWNTIEIGTKMNTFKNGVPQLDGESYVIVNGKKCVQKGINWSSRPSIDINRFDWNTFNWRRKTFGHE